MHHKNHIISIVTNINAAEREEELRGAAPHQDNL